MGTFFEAKMAHPYQKNIEVTPPWYVHRLAVRVAPSLPRVWEVLR